MNLLVLFFLLNFKAVLCLRNSKDSKCILAALPEAVLEQYDNISLLWTEAELEMVRLNIISSSEMHATTISFVSSVFHVGGGSCSEVIGVVGDLDSQTASIIHTLASRANLSITLVATSAPSVFLPVTNLDLPNLLDMNPLQYYVEALVVFMEQMNWSRIGILTDDTYYHLFTAEILQKKLLANLEIVVTPYVVITATNRNSLEDSLQQFDEYGTQIIILLVRNETQFLVLFEAVRMGYTWPKYALITFDSESYGREHRLVYEGVIILKKSVGNEHFSTLRDSILAITNNFANPLFPGSFRDSSLLTNVSIVQVRSGNDTLIATYDSKLQELEFSPESLAGESIPRGVFRIVPYQSTVVHITLVLLLSVLCFGFITVNLVLYIVFRNEPEVKATSVSVSICMFLGCYLLIAYIPTLLCQIQPINYTNPSATFICTSLVWLSIVGLSFSLIFSTLIMKMLRVYLIFCNPHSYKKKFFSNPALLLYIVVLISPIIFLLVLMTAVDAFTKVRLLNPMKSYALAFDQCSSKQIAVWVTVMLVYNVSLIMGLATLAIKSSKIRYKHFRDTKATNAFAYLSIFVSSMTAVYWYFFYDITVLTVQNINKTAAVLYIGHSAEALLCQIFLFVPKVYPPTMRWLFKNKVNSKI